MTPEERTKRDIEGIKDESTWPLWPVLPVKHKRDRQENGFPVLGIMFHAKGPVVYDVELGLGSIRSIAERVHDSSTKRWAYLSVEKLCEDWWVD